MPAGVEIISYIINEMLVQIQSIMYFFGRMQVYADKQIRFILETFTSSCIDLGVS